MCGDDNKYIMISQVSCWKTFVVTVITVVVIFCFILKTAATIQNQSFEAGVLAKAFLIIS